LSRNSQSFLIAKAIFLFFLIFAKAAFLEKWILREGLQGEILLFKWNVLRENGLSHPAKGGSTPAFACQRAAIAPLPCLNLQLISHSSTLLEFESFKKCDCSRKTILQIFDLLRKCGLLAHTSPAFLKNCWIKKLFVACGSSFKTMILSIRS
jgi:hypothetical protein